MVKLRNYTNADTDRLVHYANNENVSRYLVYTFPYPYTQKDAEWWIETGSKENKSVNKVIEYKGEFVGCIGITPQTGWKSHIAEIGYWLGEDHWRQGIATEALGKMTETAFLMGNYKKLFAPVLGPNKASMKVLEKNGYKLEAVLKQEVLKNEQYFDLYHYARHC